MPDSKPPLEVIKDRLCFRKVVFEIILHPLPPVFPNIGREIWLDIRAGCAKIEQERWLNNTHLNHLKPVVRIDRPGHPEAKYLFDFLLCEPTIGEIFIAERIS